MRHVFAAACFLVAGAAGAQSAQPFSVQASLLFTGAGVGRQGSSVGGVGVEAPGRYTRDRCSLGAGAQSTSHTASNDDNLKLSVCRAATFGSRNTLP